MKQWKCTVCGYVHTGDAPPDKCPVCGADKSLFTLITSDEQAAGTPPQTPAVGDASNKARQWRCTVCGYIHQGDSPPEKCPVCGAYKSLFVPVDEAPPEEEAPPAKPQKSTDKEEPGKALSSNPTANTFTDKLQRLLQQQPYHALTQRLTQLHGHPVAVHIPNGLLPVSVLFTLLAMMFGSDGFAVAARYNIYLVALAMPLVIATGLIDWVNRFKGRMTQVFKIKMICAAVVSLLSILIALWWLADTECYRNGIFSNMIFILFNLANLAAAGVAGWYGGKLVFRN